MNNTPVCSVLDWIRRWPHDWDHTEGVGVNLDPNPPLLLDDPLTFLSIHTVLSLGLPMCTSHHCRGHRSGETGAESPILLQARGGSLNLRLKLSQGLVLVEVVGSLLLVGRGDGAGAPGPLLDRGAPLTGVDWVIGALSMRRGRTGTLMGRRSGMLVFWQEIGLICDAVARRGSWRRVGRRGVDALEAQAEV